MGSADCSLEANINSILRVFCIPRAITMVKYVTRALVFHWDLHSFLGGSVVGAGWAVGAGELLVPEEESGEKKDAE